MGLNMMNIMRFATERTVSCHPSGVQWDVGDFGDVGDAGDYIAFHPRLISVVPTGLSVTE